MSNSPVRRAVRAAVQFAAASSLVALVAMSAHAQPPAGGGGGGGNRGTAMMMEGITLSAAQQAKVDSIVADFRTKQQAMGRPPQGDTTGMGARRKLTEDRSAAIKAVLTPEQAKTFDANMEKMRANMGGGRPAGAPQVR
jgi:Spy/CpxP family protein refolding chaperone